MMKNECFTPEVNLHLTQSGIPLPDIRIVTKFSKEDVLNAWQSLGVSRVAMVADANTWNVLGERLQNVLADVEMLKFELPPQADMETVEMLATRFAGKEALIAVGSGTVNDLCKLAAFRLNIPYIVFPTAPSMNGYASANASIVAEGKKQSFAAAAPLGIYCDLGVLAASPVRLRRAGLGDSLARPTAQADWLLSHLTQNTHYDERPFTLLAPYERALFNASAQLAEGDENAVELLMKVLLLSGLGMTMAGGSYPASQGEHLIAHAYETLAPGGDAYHGEQIGVTTLAMARLQEIRVGTLPAEIQDRIRRVMLPSWYLTEVLTKAGAPTTPYAIGWEEETYREAIRIAPALRDRYTFLNLTPRRAAPAPPPQDMKAAP